MLYESEKLTENTFIGQVYYSQKSKYVMTFIYNTYRPWMSVRTDQKKEIYGLHQSPRREVELKDSNSLEATRKETELRIHQSRAKWIGNDNKFDCDIYVIELDIGKNS